MKWFIKLLKRCASECRVIPDRLDPSKPYLTRWYLVGGRKHKWFTLCLHEFHASDPTDLHDHPFSYITWILTGGYWEETPGGMFFRKPGHFRFRSSRSQHRIQLDPSKSAVYTLFFMGPRTRNWGFMHQRQWTDHNTYLDKLTCSSSISKRMDC